MKSAEQGGARTGIGKRCFKGRSCHSAAVFETTLGHASVAL